MKLNIKSESSIKLKSLLQLYEILPENERIIVDILRQIVLENLPKTVKEKLSYNVPFFYGNKGICIIWPASISGGGIKKGVLLGFWQGNKLNDPERFLIHGTNKKVYYRIFHSNEEVDEEAIIKLLKEAAKVDNF